MPELHQSQAAEKVFPWRNMEFRKSRKGWGTVSAEVYLDGEWYYVAFTMDLAGFMKMHEFPPERLKCMLENLALFPIYNGRLGGEQPKIPRGRNSGETLVAWKNAHRLGPHILEWAVAASQSNDRTYRTVVARLKKGGYPKPDAKRVAAYLIEQNMDNAGKPWPGQLPSKNPRKFFRQLQKPKTGPSVDDFPPSELEERSVDELVRSILSGHAYVYGYFQGEHLLMHGF